MVITYFDTEQQNMKKMNLTLGHRRITTATGWKSEWYTYVKGGYDIKEVDLKLCRKYRQEKHLNLS